jgi:hypothetical protein
MLSENLPYYINSDLYTGNYSPTEAQLTNGNCRPLLKFDANQNPTYLTLPRCATTTNTYISFEVVRIAGANDLTVQCGNSGDYINGVLNGTHTINASYQRHLIHLEKIVGSVNYWLVLR